MAGRASRFKEAGYTVPKSLIDLRGKPMFVWALESLSFIKRAKLYFACLREHGEYHITNEIQRRCGKNATVFFSDHVTQGAAETALLAMRYIDTDEELIISNADQHFKSRAFEEELAKERKQFSGLIPYFEATHPRWSFVKVNGGGFATEVAEKVPISNNATVGVYYFKHGKDFVWAAKEMIKKDIRRNNEFYVCPVFNELIGHGDKIKAVPTDTMWGLGTPEDVEYFRKYYKSMI